MSFSFSDVKNVFTRLSRGEAVRFAPDQVELKLLTENLLTNFQQPFENTTEGIRLEVDVGKEIKDFAH